MNITLRDVEVETKFTFNSFRYMEDFDIKDFEDVESKPFKMIGIAEQLLYGAANNNPTVKFSKEDIYVFLDKYIEDDSIAELIETLMSELQESNFFKSLQKKPKKKK